MKFEDVTAVDSVSLQVARGELFGLLGSNGAGKTTIISILCGLLKPTSGSAAVGGYDAQRETAKVKELIGRLHTRNRDLFILDWNREHQPFRKSIFHEQGDTH